MPQNVAQMRQQKVLETMPSYRKIMARALSGEASPRQAIKAFCLHCVGDVRLEITNCTASACPLFAYRPYQADNGVEAGDDAEPVTEES
jgi:hypothetical protein